MYVTSSNAVRRLFRCLILVVLFVPLQSQAHPQDRPAGRDFDDGWSAYDAGNYRRAVAIWTALAEQGHRNAQVNLGFLYDYGNGVERDSLAAARWYRAAAVQRSAIGQYNLALLIDEGRAEPLPGRSARYWLQQAAAQGLEDARRALAQQGGTDPIHVSAGAAAGSTPDESRTIEVAVSVGTAWPIAAGYAVTNHHVIEGKRQILLLTSDGEELPASVIASDNSHDIAFLRVSNPSRLPPALPLSKRGAGLGASVFTIGFPRIDVMGKSPKLSHGIISGENGLRDDPSRYQISVPIQQGNSGGPLLDMRGEVVGMITAMLGERVAGDSRALPIPNISFALKIDVIRQFLERVTSHVGESEDTPPVLSDLEGLAARVQDSVLIVMAE